MKCQQCHNEIFGAARPLCDECAHKADHCPGCGMQYTASRATCYCEDAANESFGCDDDYDYAAEADTSYWE